MSCGKDAKKCTSVAQGHGAPEAVAVWAEGRGAGGHCPRCGGFLTVEGALCNNPHCGDIHRRFTYDDDNNISQWTRALGSVDLKVRRDALVHLKQSGHPATMPVIRQVMNNQDEDTALRWLAIEALGRLGDSTVRQTLEKTAIQSKNQQMRQRATEALGEIGDKAAIPTLEKVSKDRHRRVRTAAENAISKINNPVLNPQNATAKQIAKPNGNPQSVKHCPKCGSFLTIEGICRNDKCGWIKSPESIEGIARQSTDPEQLDRLAHLKKYAEVRAAVAENPHTSPQTLVVLANDKKAKVYQAAIKNPALTLEGLEFAGEKAEKNWQASLTVIGQRLAMSAMYYGAFSMFNKGRKGQAGEQMIAMAMLGVYGAIAYHPHRKYSAIRAELRQRRMAMTEDTGGETDTLAQPGGDTSSVRHPSPAPLQVATEFDLTPKEQDLFKDGLDIAISYTESGRDNYGETLKVEDVMRIREKGPQNDKDRLLLSGIIDEMEEAEETLPGFFNTTPAEFRVLREKLGCTKAPQKTAKTAA